MQNLFAAWIGAIMALIDIGHCTSQLQDSAPRLGVGLLTIATMVLITVLSKHLRWVWLERGMFFALGCSCPMLTVLLIS